jgi:pimeloyl-ACP methyl ester carboxylesterase
MLWIEERGTSDEIVVLLHGTPTTPDHLRPLAERLSARWRTLLVHLPGYGESADLEPYDLAQSHVLVEATLVQRRVQTAHLLGHSGGAYRAFALATRAVIQPLSVIALGAIARYDAPMRDALAAFAKAVREGMDLRPILPESMLGPKARNDPRCVADVTAWATATSAELLARELEAFIDAPDLLGAVSLLDVPILLRVGAHDTATPPARSEEIRHVARRAVLQIVPDVGHALVCEDFDETASAIEKHLRAVR